jgi:hypothetical protein
MNLIRSKKNMGRCDFTAYGEGFTQKEAFDDAVNKADEVYGHQEGCSGQINSLIEDNEETPFKATCIKNPINPKKVTFERVNTNLRQVWTSKYTVVYNGGRLREEDFFDTLLEAKKFAKKIALEKRSAVQIHKKKVIVEGSTLIYDVKPEKAEKGKWKFEGTARE